MTPSILVVDDESIFLDSVRMMLTLEGYQDVTLESVSTNVPALLEQKEFDVAFLDITMPDLDGMDLLKIIKENHPSTEVVMITANDTISSIMKASRLGATDYLLKPIVPEQLVYALDKALEHKRMLESLRLKSQSAFAKSLKNPAAFSKIITSSASVIRLLHEAELHAASDIPILITGETGVGKELMAQAIHDAGKHAKGPFVAVNMLALTPTLFESEFFGHAKGSFTGADRDKIGYLQQARGGSLFLDEIGDLSMELQGKLLRILQEGEFTPVGKTQSVKADVRFIAATNQDLEKQVQQRKFRKDLLYRLQFAHLDLPPLSKRLEDIPLLAAHFIANSARPDAALSEDALMMLENYNWPGNIRELRGALEAAANLAEKGVIEPEHLRIDAKPIRVKPTSAAITKAGDLEPLADVERRHILAVYEALDNNKSQTARVLEIGLQTLHRKLKQYNVK